VYEVTGRHCHVTLQITHAYEKYFFFYDIVLVTDPSKLPFFNNKAWLLLLPARENKRLIYPSPFSLSACVTSSRLRQPWTKYQKTPNPECRLFLKNDQ
jgi:hypothetical protein